MNAFRNEIVKLYGKCLITGYNEVECDAAHIIPQTICAKLNLFQFVQNTYNGLLLNKTMHATYDRLLWCFDIYDLSPADPNWCYIKLIIPPAKKQLSINEYKDNVYQIPINSLPFLWINYHVFMNNNFMTNVNGKDTNIYKDLLNSDIYQAIAINPALLLNEDFINNIRQTQDIVAIINKRKFGSQYQVLYQGQPWNNCQWIDNDDDTLSIDNTMHLRDKTDPVW